MAVIDFHSHILPGIDDGARNLDVSLAMLEKIREQKIDYMAATPHFYASQDQIEKFLDNRERAWDAFWNVIQQKNIKDRPKFLLGSEVAFFDGISRADEIDRLTLGNTGILLLEMPFEPWTDRNIKEVRYLIEERKLRILLAHLERFVWIPGNKKAVQKILELPVYVQINAECFLDWRHRRAIIKMFRDGVAHVLGSDCHGIHRRVPNLSEGRAVLEKKAGTELLQRIDKQGQELLTGADII